MEAFKRVLKKLFCLPPLATVLIAVPAFVLGFVALGTGVRGVLAYLSYGLSAYALILLVTGLPGVLRAAKRGALESRLAKKLQSIPHLSRFLEDRAFRTEVSLFGGLALNLAYVLIKLFSGIYYRSLWFVALSAYYLFLSLIRFLLLQHIRYRPVGQEYFSELRRYRLCGWMLLLLNLALSAIVTLVVVWNQGFHYGGYLIYVMAIYAFYVTISSVINVVKYRRYNSPVLSAAKAVSLTAALVSMLSLETAMLSQFQEADTPDNFRRIMTATTGFVVCVFVLGMAIYMVMNASKRLNSPRFSVPQAPSRSLQKQDKTR